jgi:hypothetical protein
VANVEEIKVHVAASVEGAEQAVAAIQGVTDRLDDALARLRLTAIGSVHPQVLAAMTQLEQAKQRLDEANTLTRAAMDSANTYRALI